MTREKPLGKCQFDLNWANDEIPDYAVPREFHLGFHAGLVAPSQVGDFVHILDPGCRLPQPFCSDEALRAYTAERILDFEAGSDDHMQIDRTTFTYPVFNQTYSKAVIIPSSIALDGRFRWRGKIGRHPAAVGVEADIYRKRHVP